MEKVVFCKATSGQKGYAYHTHTQAQNWLSRQASRGPGYSRDCGANIKDLRGIWGNLARYAKGTVDPVSGQGSGSSFTSSRNERSKVHCRKVKNKTNKQNPPDLE